MNRLEFLLSLPLLAWLRPKREPTLADFDHEGCVTAAEMAKMWPEMYPLVQLEPDTIVCWVGAEGFFVTSRGTRIVESWPTR